jgi:hypothetical protein
MMRDDFCVFILSHDRAGNIPTIDTLENHGYTGDWYIVIDCEEDIDPYKDEYGEKNVVYFDKDDTQPDLDRGDNFNRQNSILYARYFTFQIAEDLGYDYFMQLDDDYTTFEFRFGGNYEYGLRDRVEDLDRIINASIKYLEKADLDTICTSQGGDWIGGESAHIADDGTVSSKRKAMNSFLCKTDRQFDFRGSINEDVNTYARAQQYGKIFLTYNIVSLEQERTQQNEGGLSEMYEAEGTYVKSFYTLLYSPSSVKLTKMGAEAGDRIHHKINWNASVPKIVPEDTKD